MSLDQLNQKRKEQNLIDYWMIPNTSAGFREPEAIYRLADEVERARMRAINHPRIHNSPLP